jgi:hypothetical protein
MKQYLGGKKTPDDNGRPVMHTSLAEAVQALAITLNDLRADLLKAGLGEMVTSDVRLRESLLKQLEVVQLTAAEIRRLR